MEFRTVVYLIKCHGVKGFKPTKPTLHGLQSLTQPFMQITAINNGYGSRRDYPSHECVYM